MLELSVIQDVSYILPTARTMAVASKLREYPFDFAALARKWTLSAIKSLNFKAMFMTI